MAFFPVPGLSFGANPVEACQQLGSFVSGTAELESADPRFPAVVHTYDDVVAPFVGLFAPLELNFQGQATWFGATDIWTCHALVPPQVLV